MEIEKFKQKILAQLDEISSRAGGEPVSIQRTADNLDWAAAINAKMQQDIFTAWDKKTMERLQAALVRICDGTYGICLSCEEPIAEKRLDACPGAALCFDCQAAAERYESARAFSGRKITVEVPNEDEIFETDFD